MRVQPDPIDLAAPTEVLLRAAQCGDREAATVVVEALLPRVRNLVRYLIPGDRDVDDVAQMALMNVLRGLSGYRAEGSFQAWADRVVSRSVFAWLRHRKCDERRIDSAEDPDLLGDVGAMPDEYLERRRWVERLDRLPAEQRQVLVLHHVLGMSVPEIAAVAQVPEETVRSRLRIGRGRLRETGLSLTRKKEAV